MVKKAETDSRFASIKRPSRCRYSAARGRYRNRSTPEQNNTGSKQFNSAVDTAQPAAGTSPGTPANSATSPERNNASANGTLLTVPGAEGAVAPPMGMFLLRAPPLQAPPGTLPLPRCEYSKRPRGRQCGTSKWPIEWRAAAPRTSVGNTGWRNPRCWKSSCWKSAADGRRDGSIGVLGGNSPASNDEPTPANGSNGVLSGGTPSTGGGRPTKNAATGNVTTGNGVLGGSSNPTANSACRRRTQANSQVASWSKRRLATWLRQQ
jgi:hypothetical protein